MSNEFIFSCNWFLKQLFVWPKKPHSLSTRFCIMKRSRLATTLSRTYSLFTLNMYKLCTVSHLLGANLESALILLVPKHIEVKSPPSCTHFQTHFLVWKLFLFSFKFHISFLARAQLTASIVVSNTGLKTSETRDQRPLIFSHRWLFLIGILPTRCLWCRIFILNLQQLHCLFSSLFWLTTKKISNTELWSLVTRLFVEQLVQTKKKIKTLHRWPFCEGNTHDRSIHHTKGQSCRSVSMSWRQMLWNVTFANYILLLWCPWKVV